MMFEINGTQWRIKFVSAGDSVLRRSTGDFTVGVTDNNTKCVYLSNLLRGAFLRRVMAHELCHCFCFSYNVFMPIEEEERLANWVSLYGADLVYMLDDLMKILERVA